MHGWWCQPLLRLPATTRSAAAPAACAVSAAPPAVGTSTPLAPGEADARSRVALAKLVLEALSDLCEACEFDLAQELFVRFDCDPRRAGARPRPCEPGASSARVDLMRTRS